MHLIIYGPEGSGKGTQAKLLSEKLNLPIMTSGDLVREAAAGNQGAIGDACRIALSEGKYVSNEYIFELWKNRLKTGQSKKGFILDGFPRNLEQAEFLMKKILGYGYGIDRVIYLNLTDTEAVERLAKRHRKLFAGSRINHDDPQRVKQRLAIYRKQEQKLLDYFKNKYLLLEIDADKNIKDVFNSILSGLNLKE